MDTLAKRSVPSQGPAGEIVRLHGEIIGAMKTSMAKALRIGELLTEQKAVLPHGAWLPWVETLIFSDRTARKYMAVWQNRSKLELSSNLEQAYKFLAVSTNTPRLTTKPIPDEVEQDEFVEGDATDNERDAGSVADSPGEDEVVEPDEPERPKRRGMGVQYANDAINILKRIPVNDPLRLEGLKTVKQWVDDRLEEAGCPATGGAGR